MACWQMKMERMISPWQVTPHMQSALNIKALNALHTTPLNPSRLDTKKWKKKEGKKERASAPSSTRWTLQFDKDRNAARRF